MINLRQFYNKLDSKSRSAFWIVVAICAWLATGLWSGPPAEATKQATPAPTVAVEQLTAEPHQRHVRLVARTEPERKSRLSAQVDGEVKATPVVEGDRVTAGQVLIKLDTADRKAAVEAAKADVAAKAAQLKAAAALREEGFQSETTFAAREAELALAKQNQTAAEEALRHTNVTAPYNGLVEAVHVEVGDFASIGTTLIDLLGTNSYLIVGFVAQQDHDRIEVGGPATATLINGQQVEGKVRFVAQDANPETKTYRVEVLIDGEKYPNLPAGMSANLELPAEVLQAHKVPHAALVLNDMGTVGVMLAVSSTAVFQQVDLLDDTPQGQWVAGLPDPATVIVRGQANVKDGGQIQPSPAR